MPVVVSPELVWAGSELFLVAELGNEHMSYRVLEQTGHLLTDDYPLDGSVALRYLGSRHTDFKVGSFGVHHQVCLDSADVRSVHDMWISTGASGRESLSLADYVIHSWLQVIMESTP